MRYRQLRTKLRRPIIGCGCLLASCGIALADPPAATFAPSAQQMVAEQRLVTATERLHEARRQVDICRGRFEKLLSEREELRQKQGEIAAAEDFIRNPAWEKLTADRTVLVDQQTRLSDQFTAAHPSMQKLSADIDVIDCQLHDTAELIPAPHSDTPQLPKRREIAESAAHFALDREIEQARQDVFNAEDNFRAAQRQEQLAFEAQIRTEPAQAMTPAAPIITVGSLPIDPTIIQLIGIGIATLVAVLLGKVLKGPAKGAVKFSAMLLCLPFKIIGLLFSAPTQAPKRQLAPVHAANKIVPRRRNMVVHPAPVRSARPTLRVSDATR